MSPAGLHSQPSRLGAAGAVARMLSVLFMLAVLGPVWARAGESAVGFDLANRLYEEGKFAEAAKAYGQIIQSGQASSPLYFNLGNAYFKAGQVGRAILAYRQAKGLSARDPDVLANLQFARNQVQGPSISPGPLARWLGRLSLNEWTIFAAALVWLLFLLLILSQWRPGLRPLLRGWTTASAAVAVLLCVCLGTQFYGTRMQPMAVIITPEAALRQAPLPGSPKAETLHDGAEVRVLDQKDDWLQVTAGLRRVGWIRRDEAVLARTD
jgi:tetratricopeptide (TPR) repeat protein